MKELFEENWSRLQCGQCRWFRINADTSESTCKRLDHKHLKLAEPWFKAYDCGKTFGTVCRDFEPAARCKWLSKHWNGFDDYYQGEKFSGTMGLVIDGDNSVRYLIKRQDFVDGTFLDDSGELKWIEKIYYKQSRKSPTGYVLVRERNKDNV